MRESMAQTACHKSREKMDALFDADQWRELEEPELQTHLASCQDCMRHYQSMHALLEHGRRMRELSYHRTLTLAPLHIFPAKSWRPAQIPVYGVAFGLMLFLGAWFGSFLPMPASDTAKIDRLEKGLANRAASLQTVPVSTTGYTRVRIVVPAQEAEQVEIIGDFNNWSKRMALDAIGNGIWQGELKLKPGRYQYTIIIDGKKSIPDPAARQVVDDGFGGKNSVLEVPLHRI